MLWTMPRLRLIRPAMCWANSAPEAMRITVRARACSGFRSINVANAMQKRRGNDGRHSNTAAKRHHTLIRHESEGETPLVRFRRAPGQCLASGMLCGVAIRRLQGSELLCKRVNG